ncbi:uncharacterized protein FPRN_13238 [Fusarium proliferatum]|nr:uncharacterized protein FPRN_13238 [Fusarium proliferatum]
MDNQSLSAKATADDIGAGERLVQSDQKNAATNAPEPPQIAICGIALRLPGGISNCDDYWNLLYHGLDARRPIPNSRFNIEGFNDSLGGKDSIKTTHGYFIEDDLSCLDTSFFSMGKNELAGVDPQQRLLLEVTQECLDDAGETSFRGKQIGCYIGTFGDDWLIMNTKESLQGGVYATTGGTDIMMANRTSYEFDFQGPSMVIKTGCSSSAVALHEACRAIQKGDASSAIVGGANMIMTPAMTTTMSVGEILAPDASCKTFDAAADGYARAEAITAIYIKPLSDAIRDGNPVRAIVRATAVNCDGKCVSLVTPNGAAHEALMRKAYRDFGLDPKDTAFVEGLHFVREREFLENVEASLFISTPSGRISTSDGFEDLLSGELSPWKNNGHIVVGLRSDLHLDDPKNPTNWRRDRRMGAYHNLPTGAVSQRQGEGSLLKIFLQGVSEGDAIATLAKEESIDFISMEIGKKVNEFLLRPDAPVDPNLKLSEMGIDSLTAIELRRWFGQVFRLQDIFS